jgi:uncharacterized protein (DUF2062 family)
LRSRSKKERHRKFEEQTCENSTLEHRIVKEGFLKQRLVRPILDLLRKGVTPEKIALSLALGAALGIFPLLGCSTFLCTVAAVVLGLNLPAIQLMNYFMYPVQIALLLPFFRLGERLFGSAHLPLSPSQVSSMIHANFWAAIKLLWTTIWHAIVVWGLVSPLFVALTYVILVPVLRHAMQTLTSPSRTAL